MLREIFQFPEGSELGGKYAYSVETNHQKEDMK